MSGQNQLSTFIQYWSNKLESLFNNIQHLVDDFYRLCYSKLNISLIIGKVFNHYSPFIIRKLHDNYCIDYCDCVKSFNWFHFYPS